MLDPQEIPTDELAGRVARLQRSLQQEGVAAALIYGDVYRSGDMTYLSNICIYWNEGLLVVPATGNPVLLTKLSPRVHPWMRSISTLQDLRSGANLADLVSSYLKGMSPGIVGLVEMDWWPAAVLDDLRAKLPGREFRNLGTIIKQERQLPSETELRLLRTSAGISAEAVAAGLDRTLTNPQRAGRAEFAARMAGVEDVLAFCYPSTDQADTVEVFAEYRGYWTCAARIVAKGSLDWASKMIQAYEAARQSLRAGIDVAGLRKAAGTLLGDSAASWRIDIIHHTDLETGGDYRLPGEEENPVQAGSVVTMRLELAFSDGTRAVAADTFEIHVQGSICLTKGLPDVFSQS